MSDEAEYRVKKAVEAFQEANDPDEWIRLPSLCPFTTKSVRDEVEALLRSLGFEVARQYTLSSGQRLRGLWLRKHAVEQ